MNRARIAPGRALVVLAGLLLGVLLLACSSGGGDTTVLTVISGDVQVQESGSDAPRAAEDGEELNEGDQVITGNDGRAVVTFFEGSTQVLEPNTGITIKQVGTTDGGGLLAHVGQSVGKTWNTVLDSSGSGSDVQVEAPASSAAVRDTMFQVDVAEDGTTDIWSRQGAVAVTAEEEEDLASAGLHSTTEPGGPLGAAERVDPAVSELKVELNSATWLLVTNPEGLASGCVPPGGPVNQIRLTVISDCFVEPQTLAMITMVDGTHQLYLAAKEDGEYDLSIEGTTDGEVVCQETASGQVEEDERRLAELRLDVEDGVLVSCALSEFEQTDEPPPAKFVLPDKLTDAIEEGQRLIPELLASGQTPEPTSQVLAAESTPSPTSSATSETSSTPRPPATPTPTTRRSTSTGGGPSAAPPPPATRTPTPRPAAPTPTRTPRPPTATPTFTPLPPQFGHLKGSVLDSVTHQRVLQATVTVLGTGLSTAAQADGFFLITDVPTGPQTVQASAPGYVTQTREITVIPGANPILYFLLVRQLP
ncbi:MAG: carboxypeptidase regulatory-like domain-containing protein [Dehalococcoidia bacterium]